MGDRWQRLVTEASRFLGVGLLATIVALFLFNLLLHGFGLFDEALLRGRPILAYVVANGIGMGISYRGSRSWAFREREPAHPDGGRIAFVAINLATMLVPIACLWVSRNVMGLDDPLSDNIAANVLGLVLGMLGRFYLLRRFVFVQPLPKPPLPHLPHLLPGTPDAQDDDRTGSGDRRGP